MGVVPAALPRRRCRLPACARKCQAERAWYLRAGRGRLSWRLRSLDGVGHGEHIVGLIDFDHARPAPALFDVAYALEYAAPFRDDRECQRWLRYSQPPDRRRRIEAFCAAYGIAVPDDITCRVAEQQRLTLQCAEALARQGIEPQATWAREGHLDAVRARIDWTEALQL
jgi:hypothetical protein